MFSYVHRSVNVRKLSCVPAFSEVLLCFSCIFPTSKRARIQVNACFPMLTPFDELLENIVSSRVRRKFLVFSGTVSSGEFKKTLVS